MLLPHLKLSLPLLIAVTLLSAACSKSDSAALQPPVAIRALPAVSGDVPLEVTAIGNVEAISTVDVKSRVAGQVLKVNFQEGQDVRQGSVLFEIDSETYLRQIAEIEANMARDSALERQARANVLRDEATLKQQRAQADRALALAKDGIYSREQTEQSVSAADAAQASLDADRAAIESATAAVKADRARLAETKLLLDYTKIAAPISGRAGAISAKQGNMVKDNDSVMVTLLQVSPIYVSFGVPEQVLPEVRKYDANHPLEVEALAADGSRVKGLLRFIDNTVDNTTGTIKLKAEFENGSRALWPGQFVNIRARLNVEHDRVLVPSRTVQTGPNGKYVWVMNPSDSTVAMRSVNVLRNYASPAAGDQAVIGGGLHSGEMVVSEGQMRLAPGAKVRLLQAAAHPAAS